MKNIVYALFVFVLFASTSAHAIVLGFDEPPISFQDGYGDGDSFSEDGFLLTNYSDQYGSFIRFNPDTQNAIVPNNGTTHVGITFGGGPVLTREDGGIFSFISLDIAEYSEHVMWVNTFELLGYQAGGGVLSAELSLDNILDGVGGQDDFQNYLLNWENLIRVEFASDGVAFDNLVVNPVPSPSTISLLMLPMLFLLIGRKNTNISCA